MSERGEYRSIPLALIDGPDFQRLPERARGVFIMLKLNFGPVGIGVWYPAELVARLAAQTGASPGGIQDALMTLEGEGWMQREANVVWIVGQLEFDPHVKIGNPKHRTMVQSVIDGLPRLRIVGRFIKKYELWFRADGLPTGSPSAALRKAIDSLSDSLSSGYREAIESQEGIGEGEQDKKESLGSSDDDPAGEVAAPTSKYPPEFETTWAIYPKRTGGNSKAEAFRAWKARLRAGVTVEILHDGVKRYRAWCDREQKTGSQFVKTAAAFFGPGEHYLEPWTSAPAQGAASRPRLVTENPTEEADRRHTAEVAMADRYAAAKRRAIAAWAEQRPDEYAECVARVDRQYAGKSGAWIATARDAELEHVCGEAAGFPSFDAWLDHPPSAGAA